MSEETNFQNRLSQESNGLCPVSLEVTANEIKKIPLIAKSFPPGTRVNITFLKKEDMSGQVDIAKAIRLSGLEPVPHIAARYYESHAELESHLHALTSAAQVTEALVIGGNPQTTGVFDSTLKLLETGLLQKHGIRRIGLAGHPEGNEAITSQHGKGALLDALAAKQSYLREHSMEGYISTQFLFDSKPLIEWAKRIVDNGIDLPIHAGISGPNTIFKLIKFAGNCGVAQSLAFSKTHSINIGSFLAAPDELVEDVVKARQSQPELGIAALHFYPFGNVEGLIDWMKRKPELFAGNIHR